MGRSFRRGLAPLLLVSFVAAGCATVEENPKATLGGALGAAGGGLIGAAAGGGTTGIVGGVLLGGLLGGVAGGLLDQRDKELAMKQAQMALETAPSGQTTTWNNPDSGNSGSFTPVHTYPTPSGQYCREFTQTITIDGQPQRSYGTACRQPDGTWKIQ